MASEKITTVGDDNFAAEVLSSQTPVLVDFWAEWCGPCRMVAPALEQLADEFDGKVRIAKLNVDHNQRVAMQYDVRSIPTFILFKDGKIADRLMGAMPKAAFSSFLQKHV